MTNEMRTSVGDTNFELIQQLFMLEKADTKT